MSFLKKRLFIFDTDLWKIHIDPSWTFTPWSNSPFRSARGTKRDHIMDFQYPQDVLFLGKFDGRSESEASVKKLCLFFFDSSVKVSNSDCILFCLFYLFSYLFIQWIIYFYITLYQLKIKAYNKITDKKDSCYELRFQSYRLYKTSISNASFAHNQQGQLSQCHVFILSLRIDREGYCLISAETRFRN